MRAFVILVDQIIEVEGSIRDTDFQVFRSANSLVRSGELINKFNWSLTRDYAYILLEQSLKKHLEDWKTYAEMYKKDNNDYDYKRSLEQARLFDLMIPKARLMDPMFIKKLQ